MPTMDAKSYILIKKGTVSNENWDSFRFLTALYNVLDNQFNGPSYRAFRLNFSN